MLVKASPTCTLLILNSCMIHCLTQKKDVTDVVSMTTSFYWIIILKCTITKTVKLVQKNAQYLKQSYRSDSSILNDKMIKVTAL